MKKFVCLLTGTISPLEGLPFTNLNDKEIRKRQYIESIIYYLNNFKYPIVFVENSGNDLSDYFSQEINKGFIEILTFEGNSYPANLGKGMGEIECINYAMSYSKFISSSTFIFKITGRYQVKNLSRFITQWLSLDNIISISNTNFSKCYTDTRFIGFSPYFKNRYLERCVSILNDSKGIYLEHVMFNSIKSAIDNNEKVDLFKGAPKIEGIAGSMNVKYKSGIMRHLYRHLKETLKYYKFHLIKSN